MHGEGGLPEGEIEGEAADHAEDGSVLRGVARKGAEEEDA